MLLRWYNAIVTAGGGKPLKGETMANSGIRKSENSRRANRVIQVRTFVLMLILYISALTTPSLVQSGITSPKQVTFRS